MGLKIDDVAKETGLTKRTIRYYEEIGLIPPPKRTDNGIRLYSDENVNQIKKVLIAKEVLGFSLQELQQFLQINRLIEEHYTKYQSLEDIEKRKMELSEIAEGLHKEIEMLENKIINMQNFRQELVELRNKVHECLR